MDIRIVFRLIFVSVLILSIVVCTNAQPQPVPKPLLPAKIEPVKAEPIPLPLPGPCHCLAETKIITFYENDTIPSGVGISRGNYISVEGYRYINITVEFEQVSATEKPVSLGVMFAYGSNGEVASRRYFNFEDNFTGDADPLMITLTGKNSWHGSPHNKSTYTARLPIMGPYLQVFPFNHETRARRITIKAYLST
jgi:hypothetical protein